MRIAEARSAAQSGVQSGVRHCTDLPYDVFWRIITVYDKRNHKATKNMLGDIHLLYHIDLLLYDFCGVDGQGARRCYKHPEI